MRQQVNLLSADLLPRPERLPLGQLLVIWASACALLLIFSGWDGFRLWDLSSARSTLQARWQSLRDGNAELEAEIIREPEAVLAAQVQDMARSAARRERLLSYLADDAPVSGPGFALVLADLSRQAVSGLWLDRIVIAAGGRRLELHGQTTEPARVPALLKALSKAPSLEGRRFDSLKLEQREEDGVLAFVVAGPDEVTP